MIPPRLPDWRPRLSAYLIEVASKPFAYGSHDCALFVAGAVQAMTGHDPAAAFKGQYSDLKSGLKHLRKAGLQSHIDLADASFDPVPLAFAGVGDIAVIDVPGEVPALGIFEGQHIAVPRETGLGFVPREAATIAYRVP